MSKKIKSARTLITHAALRMLADVDPVRMSAMLCLMAGVMRQAGQRVPTPSRLLTSSQYKAHQAAVRGDARNVVG